MGFLCLEESKEKPHWLAVFLQDLQNRNDYSNLIQILIGVVGR